MAEKLSFSFPVHGMSFIWNVSGEVGDRPTSANAPEDVNLVKILLHHFIRLAQPAVHVKCRQPFPINGEMDLNTAYWIHYFNAVHSHRGSFAEEGIISPARGGSFSPNDTWSIVRINYNIFQRDPNCWQNLPDSPGVSPALRTALTRENA